MKVNEIGKFCAWKLCARGGPGSMELPEGRVPGLDENQQLQVSRYFCRRP